MRGTPGFVGDRLREAREARGLSAVSLADLLGITRQAISLYESGHHGTNSP
jgi:transcriptional regulator with XRE-family HTH domain